MKKRYAGYVLAALLLLTGCAGIPEKPVPTEPETLPVQTIPAEAPTQEPTEEETVMPTQPVLLVQPRDSDLVRVRDYIPDALEELKYATSDNFTGAVIYNFSDSFLRYGTVKKLMAVQEELRPMGLGLKIWDGFRPVSAQFKLWEICPDPTYVANPNVGYSNHSRGFAVDLTLVDAHGQELPMPTGFDDFSGLADRNYTEIGEPARSNVLLLENIMERHGFSGYSGEWWHFNDTDKYDVEQVFDPGVIGLWRVHAEDHTVMLEQPEDSGTFAAEVARGETVTVMGYSGQYALVQWNGLRGYILCSDLSPA